MRRSFDQFMVGNAVLWSAVILFGYQWRRLEFHMYVLLVLLQVAGMAMVWWATRRVALPPWLLVLIQVAILLHLAGGSLFVGGVRLYDCYVVPVTALPPWLSQLFRYDKLVHMYVPATAAAGLWAMWGRLGLGSVRHGLVPVIIGLVVLGGGALVEVVEYIGTKAVHLPDVGGYDNNLQDLLANLIGVGAALVWLKSRRPGGWPP